MNSVSGHFPGPYDEASLARWAETLRNQLTSPADLGLVFLTPALFDHARPILETLRVHARVPLLLGCSSTGLIADGHEHEDDAGLSLGLFALPGAELRTVRFTQDQVAEATNPAYWHAETGIAADATNGWLVFADPFSLDAEAWLRGWNEAYATHPILGGLASGDFAARATQLYLNGEVFEDGGVALSVGGAVSLMGVISQGCTPIGETWTVTRAERNIIHEIGSRPAYTVLSETFNALSAEDQRKSRSNLFVGLVINEYQEEHQRGDFLVRNLIGADPQSGALAVGAFPRVGQTVQFQRRDAEAATEDMEALLARAQRELAGAEILGGCLCCCNGRGRGLFGEADHDAALIQQRLGQFGVTGFFCNGEIGPVGNRNFLHGYTASLALFVKKK